MFKRVEKPYIRYFTCVIVVEIRHVGRPFTYTGDKQPYRKSSLHSLPGSSNIIYHLSAVIKHDVDHTYIKLLLLMMDINYVILLFFVFQTKYFF